MIATIVSALATIVQLADDHPEVVKVLAARVKDLLDGHDEATMHSLEAQRAMAAGIAAACANAVQAAVRQRDAKEFTGA